MADEQKGLGPVKRFGVRYGRTVKYKLAKIEIEQKKAHVCPYCSKPKVYRIAYGIWQCGKCKNKFTAHAYTVGRKLSLVEQAAKLATEFPVMESKAEIVEEEES